jgi:hypothetical protein
MARKLDSSYIQTGTITTTQLSSAVTTLISAGGSGGYTANFTAPTTAFKDK